MENQDDHNQSIHNLGNSKAVTLPNHAKNAEEKTGEKYSHSNGSRDN
jgi:hypothetical protein